LYAKLPLNDIMKFTADLSELFPAGIYDTKYIAEYFNYSTSSFLEYLYKKW
jgi:target of EGR1 protein 1